MKKIINSFCILVLIFASLINITYAYRQETAKVTPYYSHPVTGVIEDPGNNPGIGQGMTENVLSPQALVESTDDGRIFLSVRFNLANYIKNESFAVQNYGDENFYSVKADVTNQTNETRDYRFEIPGNNAIVRSSFFVEPMGRDVIFYYTISDLVAGNTDFKTLEKLNQSHESHEVNKSEGQVIENPNKYVGTGLEENKGLEENPEISDGLQGSGEKIEQKATNDKFSAGDLGYDHGLLTKDSEIIKKLFYSDDEDKEEMPKRKLGKITLGFIYALIGLFVILTGGLILLAFLSYVYKNKVEEDLEEERRRTYE